ncbi:MAG TPA: luciferase family protein [Thermomicrobiales bacterium]|nr:luciferase family protein [Thermomicrobiales bacterium]
MIGTIRQAIIGEVARWPGVDVDDANPDHPQFHVGKIELGHLHDDAVAHLPFPRKEREALIERGEVGPHPLFPTTGWVERRIAGEEDIEHVLRLFRMNYDRAAARSARVTETEAPPHV